jgi:hypothetical protein
MAIVVNTPNPKGLLEGIKKGIDKGTVDTWIYDKDGDFTHEPEQWKNQAWLRPHISFGILQFGLLGPKDTIITKTVYGVHHGRFIEMLLTHFDKEFSNTTATAQKDSTPVDNFK